MRRTDPDFWRLSDTILSDYARADRHPRSRSILESLLSGRTEPGSLSVPTPGNPVHHCDNRAADDESERSGADSEGQPSRH